MHRSRLATGSLAGAILAVAAFAGCAEPEESSLCPAYEQYLGDLGDLVALDSEVVIVQDAIEQVDTVLASLRQLDAAGDDRHGDEVTAMASALDDLQRTLRGVDPGEDYDVWRPLIDDTVADVGDAARQLQHSLDPECRPGS